MTIVKWWNDSSDDGGGLRWDLHSFSSARKATAAHRSLGDLLRVAFSGLCVISYANWIKNESHFTIPYLCLFRYIFFAGVLAFFWPRASQIRPPRSYWHNAINNISYCPFINWENAFDVDNFHGGARRVAHFA